MVKEPRGCIRLDDREGMVVPLLFYQLIMVERFACSNDPGSLVVDGCMPLVELPLANRSPLSPYKTPCFDWHKWSWVSLPFLSLFPASPGPCVASQQSIKKLASALAATAKSRMSFCSFIWHTCMFYFWSAQEPPWVLYCVVSQLFQANCWIWNFRPVHDC